MNYTFLATNTKNTHNASNCTKIKLSYIYYKAGEHAKIVLHIFTKYIYTAKQKYKHSGTPINKYTE